MNRDADTLAREIEWPYRCGADGIVMALVSKVLRLTSEERRHLAELACRCGSPCGLVVISVGAEREKLAAEYAQGYELSLPISSLVAMCNSLDAFLAVEKYLLVKQGIFRNQYRRGPVGYMLDEESRREVDRLFARITAALDRG